MSVVTSVCESPASATVPRQLHLHVVPTPAGGVHEVSAPSERPAFRRMLVLLALAVVVLGALLAGRAMASPEPTSRGVVVRAGETLSQIAAREMPDVPTGRAVVQIERVNGLSSAHVDAGQKVVIPTP